MPFDVQFVMCCACTGRWCVHLHA